MITCVFASDEEVILLTLYDKKVKADLYPGELDQMLENLE